jgi:hypothetical protein
METALPQPATAPWTTQYDPERIARAKMPYAIRRVPRKDMATLLTGSVRPRAGNLVLARVEKLGQHSHLELASGRRARLFVGDEIVLSYGNRYAPDQFEAIVPDSLAACHMVAAGGIASMTLSRHGKMSSPTMINPIGLLGDKSGSALNLANYTLDTIASCDNDRPFTIAVAGASMNAGKTETATSLIKGLVRSGIKVGAAKITGTAAGGDVWSMVDAGAEPVLDFSDTGFPSTYLLSAAQVETAMITIMRHLCAAGVNAVVLEIADGLFQQETAELLRSPVFTERVDAVVFAAKDALSAVAGVEWLRRHHLPIVAVSGILTSSPLAIREAQTAIGLPVLDPETLGSVGSAALMGITLHTDGRSCGAQHCA